MTMEHEGDPNCEHKWVEGGTVHPMSPMLYHRICTKCGRVEHFHKELFPAHMTFENAYQKFHGDGKEPVANWRRP